MTAPEGGGPPEAKRVNFALEPSLIKVCSDKVACQTFGCSCHRGKRLPQHSKSAVEKSGLSLEGEQQAEPEAGSSKDSSCELSGTDCIDTGRLMSGDMTRCLGKGSCPPGPVPEGVIRIYSMRFCPYSHRTRLVLKAKGIRHEVININLKSKPDWYYSKHPFGQIPVLENSQCQLIYESVIACEYLDDVYPGRKLFPYDPYERARQKMLLELFCKVPHLSKECLVALRCGRDCSDLKVALRQELCNMEEILEYQNTTFFGGDCISMIDYLVWPWFERLDVYGLADCVNHTPMLRLWISSMKQDPTVCALHIDKNIFLGFLNLYFQNNPCAFDFGLCAPIIR